MTRFVALAALALATLALSATVALGSTGPGKQRAPIKKAALSLFKNDDRAKWRVRNVRISSVDKRWAIAFMNPKRAYRDTLQSFFTVLVRVPRLNDSTYWVVADLGNAFVGCDLAPPKVLQDLYRSETPCPPGS